MLHGLVGQDSIQEICGISWIDPFDISTFKFACEQGKLFCSKGFTRKDTKSINTNTT